MDSLCASDRHRLENEGPVARKHLKTNPVDFLNSLINYEKVVGYNYNIEDYKNFLKLFDNPQNKLKNIILIAGTKGKGSTAAIINACLLNHKYKVGLYTSPHLKRINERITINNRPISDDRLNEYIEIIKPHINMRTRIGARTYFEVLTTITFLYFSEENVDFAILEVGLGGRLDATNVANPLMSVITRIGYDHTNLLGKKLSQIATEKAGIIKKNGKLITIHQRSTVARIIKNIAVHKKNKIIFAEDLHKIKIENASINGSKLRIQGALGSFGTFLPLAGSHQIENLSIALAVLNELKSTGFNIDIRLIKTSIRKIKLHGRFEIISKNPLTIFDCAHNQDSFQALHRNLDLVGIKDFYLIFGTNRDKEIKYCLKYIFPKAREVLLVKADNPRAMEPKDLYTMAKKYQKNLIIGSSIEEAIRLLKRRTHGRSAILITGSFYLWPL